MLGNKISYKQLLAILAGSLIMTGSVTGKNVEGVILSVDREALQVVLDTGKSSTGEVVASVGRGDALILNAGDAVRGDLVRFGDWFSQGRGVVTVCKPTVSSNLFMKSAKRKILVAALWAVSAVLILGIVTSAWVTRPIGKLTVYAKAIRDGKRDRDQPRDREEGDDRPRPVGGLDAPVREHHGAAPAQQGSRH